MYATASMLPAIIAPLAALLGTALGLAGQHVLEKRRMDHEHRREEERWRREQRERLRHERASAYLDLLRAADDLIVDSRSVRQVTGPVEWQAFRRAYDRVRLCGSDAARTAAAIIFGSLSSLNGRGEFTSPSDITQYHEGVRKLEEAARQDLGVDA